MKNTISILVVDDEAVMRSLLEKILTREGYNVRTAEHGLAALDVLSHEQIDIVLSDMKMPHMNGFELLKRIRKDYRNIGVIIMTAYGDTYTIKDALLLGADEYITKPFNSYEVMLVVERAYWRILSGRNPAMETSAEKG